MRKIPDYLFLLFLPLVFPSCGGSCRCTKDLGCTILSATSHQGNILKEKKTYCTAYNYYNDPVLADSVNAFTQRHQGDFTLIDRKDSIYYSQSTDRIKPKETGYYENQGYFCTCAK